MTFRNSKEQLRTKLISGSKNIALIKRIKIEREREREKKHYLLVLVKVLYASSD